MEEDNLSVELTQKKPLTVKQVGNVVKQIRDGNKPIMTGITALDHTANQILKHLRRQAKVQRYKQIGKLKPADNKPILISKESKVQKPLSVKIAEKKQRKVYQSSVKSQKIIPKKAEKRDKPKVDKSPKLIPEKTVKNNNRDISIVEKIPKIVPVKSENRDKNSDNSIAENVSKTPLTKDKTKDNKSDKTNDTLVPKNTHDQLANQRAQKKSAKETGKAVAESIEDRDSILMNKLDMSGDATDAAAAAGGPIAQAIKEGATLVKTDSDSFFGKLTKKIDDKTGISQRANKLLAKAEDKTGIKKLHDWLDSNSNDEKLKELEAEDGRYKDREGKFISKQDAIKLIKSERLVPSEKTAEPKEVETKKIVPTNKPSLSRGELKANQNEQDALEQINETLVKNEKDQKKRDKKRDRAFGRSGSGSGEGFSLFDLLPGGGKGKGKGKKGFFSRMLAKFKGAKASKIGGKLIGKGGLAGGAALGGGLLAKAGGILKGGLKVAGRVTSKLPIIGLLAAAGMAIWDFTDGVENAAEITGKAAKDLTVLDKVKSGFSTAVSGITFGLISTKSVYKGLEVAGKSLSDGFNYTKTKVGEFKDSIVKTAGEFKDSIVKTATAIGERVEQSLAKTAGKDVEDMTLGDKIQAGTAEFLSAWTLGTIKSEEIFKRIETAGNSLSEGFEKTKGVVGEFTDSIGNYLSKKKEEINKELADTAGKDVEDMGGLDYLKAIASKGAEFVTGGKVDSKDAFDFLSEDKTATHDDSASIGNDIFSMQPDSKLNEDRIIKPVVQKKEPIPILEKKESTEKPDAVYRVDEAVRKLKETEKIIEKTKETNNHTVHEKIKPVFTDADRIPTPLHEKQSQLAMWMQGKS